MQIKAKKSGRCAYPPIGRYISTPPMAKNPHIIKPNVAINIQLRPDGARQPTAEARVLANINLIAQGFGPINGDVLNRG